MADKSNQNNGLITKIWGPPMWKALHSIAFGYPIEPTEEHKKNYMEFFIQTGNILPCKYCRESYKKFISEGCAKLTYKVMDNRESLTRWLYLLHNAVNIKLGVNYGVSYNDIVKKYESYRAKCSKNKDKEKKAKGCLMPLNLKANSYANAELKDCPIIPSEAVNACIMYGKLREVDNYFLDFAKNISNKDNYIKLLGNKHDEGKSIWDKRNRTCADIISKMRKDGTSSIETDGKWEGFPTIDELKLMLLASTNLPNDVLGDVINKLTKNYTNKTKTKRYILTK